MLLTIVFFTYSLPTYLNYNTIFLNVGYKKLLRGICWVLFSLLLDWSFWSFDYFWKILDFIGQASSLRTTIVYKIYLQNPQKIVRWSFGVNCKLDCLYCLNSKFKFILPNNLTLHNWTWQVGQHVLWRVKVEPINKLKFTWFSFDNNTFFE